MFLDVSKEYERIKALFEGVDEKQLNLVDGAIWEAARIRVDLDELYEIKKQSGLIKVHPKNPALQKENPIVKNIVKFRASYLNYIAKLSNLLGKNIDEEDDSLNEYE